MLKCSALGALRDLRNICYKGHFASALVLLLQFNGLALMVDRQFAVATVRVISKRPLVGWREVIVWNTTAGLSRGR